MKTREPKIHDIPKIFTGIGDRTVFAFEGWDILVRVEADEEPYEVEPRVGVVVKVGKQLHVKVPYSMSIDRFIELGESSLWGIEGLDTDYAREVVLQDLHEAVYEAELMLEALKNA